MYALKNKVQLIGNLGNAPEVKELEEGKKITETQWHNVVAWGKIADIAEKFLLKGTEVALEGKLVNRNYTDKQGVKKYITEVVVNELLLMGNKTAAHLK